MIGTDQNICVNCGLCCDGTLFKQATIKEHEIIDPSYAFDIIHQEDGIRAFKLGCCYLKNKTCTIYGNRPYSICGSFHCKLLTSLLNNTTLFDEALIIVKETIDLKCKIESRLSTEFPEMNQKSFQMKKRLFEKYYFESADKLEFRQKFGSLLLDLAVFTLKTEKYFYKENVHGEQIS